MYYVANDLQFYTFIMMPSIYIYHKRNKRWLVLSFLTVLVIASMLYLFYVTMKHSFSCMLVISDDIMFDDLYRRPFGPVGFYALGILLSILYFEYS
jgi:uncharacterized protein with PQ loop repeat